MEDVRRRVSILQEDTSEYTNLPALYVWQRKGSPVSLFLKNAEVLVVHGTNGLVLPWV